jgi:hypothetical protein
VPRTQLEAERALAEGRLLANLANTMRRSHRRRLEVGEAGRDEGGTVKLDVQLTTAGQIDCGCPESGGRLAVLGRVDLCPADPRILRDFGSGREGVLECAAHQDFIELVSTILSRK